MAGFLLGASVCWALGLIYLAAFNTDSGSLAVPLVLVAGVAFLAGSRRAELKPGAWGALVGAATETIFLFYLFWELSSLENF